MNRRERVLTSLRHKEPDRVPIDLGAMDSTGITAVAYNRLKSYLNIHSGCTRVFDPYQQVVLVEEMVLERIHGDVKPVYIGPRQWKSSQLPDDSECQVPALWNPERLPDGSQVVRDQTGKVTARMPAGGLYFEPIGYPLQHVETIADIERLRPVIETSDWPDFADEDYADLARRARDLHENTDYALMGNFCAHVFAGAQMLRGFDTFMIDLLTNPALAECLMNELAEAYIRRFEHYVSIITTSCALM
jgi:uroporphyrinogen decarboxylase